MQHEADDSSDTQSEWEVGGADDDDVEYVWDQRQAWRRQQQAMPPVPAMPVPTCAVEASALLARFRPLRSTPEDLRRLLEARADPDIMVGIGSICPLDNVMTFARTVHVLIIIHIPMVAPLIWPYLSTGLKLILGRRDA